MFDTEAAHLVSLHGKRGLRSVVREHLHNLRIGQRMARLHQLAIHLHKRRHNHLTLHQQQSG